MPRWTEEQQKQLEALVAKKLTAGQIGQKIGRPRNAVIGRIHRTVGLGKLSVRQKQQTTRASKARDWTPPAAAEPAPPPKKPSLPAVVAKQPVKRVADAGIRHTLPAVIGKPVPFLELGPRRCKFPVSGQGGHLDPFLFCNEPSRDEDPYCAAHCAVAFNGFTSKPFKPWRQRP